VLVAVLAPIVVLEAVLRTDLPWPAISIPLALGLLPTLLWRRTRPLAMVAVAFTACGLAGLLTTGEPPGTNTMVYLVLLPYALFRWGSGREAGFGAVIVFGKVVVAVLDGDLGPGDTFGAFAILFAAMATGGAVRYRTGARTRELDQATLLERERLARDLHDTVAHHVSAIVIRAQAGLATAGSEPDAAIEALRVIEEEASRTLAEMRAIVRVLRRDRPAELEPGPRVADLVRLAGRVEAGPPVDVEVSGELDDLPAPVAAAIYRLAQESVTNARRHARDATRIEVRIVADATAVRMRVTDDGDAGPPSPAAPGYGLRGMTERAALLGGTCQAGPHDGRGWTVTAVLPRAGWAT
jgi:signal transduction histidine kinase